MRRIVTRQNPYVPVGEFITLRKQDHLYAHDYFPRALDLDTIDRYSVGVPDEARIARVTRRNGYVDVGQPVVLLPREGGRWIIRGHEDLGPVSDGLIRDYAEFIDEGETTQAEPVTARPEVFVPDLYTADQVEAAIRPVILGLSRGDTVAADNLVEAILDLL